MLNKLKMALDIVLSARVIHGQVEAVKAETHTVCDPHMLISATGRRPTIQNVVDVAVELALVDAAAVLSKECLDEVEKLSRKIAKTVAQVEALKALGASQLPIDIEEEVEQEVSECASRLDEMSKVLELAAARSKDLVRQL